MNRSAAANDLHDESQFVTPEDKRPDQLLTVREVAGLLHVPTSWVYGHLRRRSTDRIPAFRVGKYWRFSEQDVTAWLRAKRTKN
jgi:excisionase family DNA binding protein